MIIVWKGFGFLIPVVFLMGTGIVVWLFPPMAQYTGNVYIYGMITLLSFGLDWLVKKRRNATCEVHTEVNEKNGRTKTRYYKRKADRGTGGAYLFPVEDSFFWIPLRIWPYVFAVLAIVMFVVSLMQ